MKEKEKELIYQQGDVLLYRANSIPEQRKLKKDPRGAVLAEGEATGHYHAIKNDTDVKLYECNGVMYLNVTAPAELEHQEHGNVIVEPDIYEIGIVQEYDHFAEEARNVKD